MKIMIEATNKLTDIDGVDVRLWEGVTEGGIPCKVFVHRIAVHNDDGSSEFEKELSEKLPEGKPISLRQIL